MYLIIIGQKAYIDKETGLTITVIGEGGESYGAAEGDHIINYEYGFYVLDSQLEGPNPHDYER